MTTTHDVAVRDHQAVAQSVPAGALAIEAGQTAWTTMQLAAFGQLGIADAPEGDKGVFLHVSQRTGLDPFSKQIYMIPRWDYQAKRNKYTIQTGIEGFRVMRSRAERLEGVRGILSRPLYYDGEGKEYPVWVSRGVPVAVEMTYTVRDRNGVETPYTSILRFDEYRQTRKETRDNVETQVLSGQWATKPTHMLEKCTEADVYRKAFPQDFSGVQLDDAMPPPDLDAPAPRQAPEVADLRQRAAAQTVTSTVIPPDTSSAQPAAPPAGSAGEVPADRPTGAASAAGSAEASAGAGPAPARTAQPARPIAMAQPGQVRVIGDSMDHLGYAGDKHRAARLRVIARLADRTGPIAAPEDLTGFEAATAIRRLKTVATPEDLDGLLAELAGADDPRDEETTDAQ